MNNKCRATPTQSIRTFLIVAILSVLSGCATLNPGASTPASNPDSAGSHWHRIDLKLNWPQSIAPDFSLHLLLADEILRDIIADCADDLDLWRFHRRAVRDSGGHNFGFLYYSKPQINVRIVERLTTHPLMIALLDSNVVETVRYRREKRPGFEHIEATSDKNWPVEIQKSWPYFIQGVSQSWLDLIVEERKAEDAPVPDDVTQKIKYYQQLNNRITQKWGQYGRHAYMHHINAIFGFAPVYMFESESWQRF